MKVIVCFVKIMINIKINQRKEIVYIVKLLLFRKKKNYKRISIEFSHGLGL